MLSPKGKIINRKAIRAKKIVTVTFISLLIFSVVWLGGIFLVMYYQPLYISPLPLSKLLSLKQDNKEEQIATSLQAKKIAFTDIKEASNAAYIVKLEKGEEVIISSEKDIDRQISSLQVIIFRLTMEGKRLLKLDLRFQNPIITVE